MAYFSSQEVFLMSTNTTIIWMIRLLEKNGDSGDVSKKSNDLIFVSSHQNSSPHQPFTSKDVFISDRPINDNSIDLMKMAEKKS